MAYKALYGWTSVYMADLLRPHFSSWSLWSPDWCGPCGYFETTAEFFFFFNFLTSCIQKCACRNECKTVCMCLYVLTCTLIFNVWFYANCKALFNSVFRTCYTNKVIVHEKGAFYMEWPNVGSQLIHYVEKVMKVVRKLFVQLIVSMGRGPINCGVLQKCSLWDEKFREWRTKELGKKTTGHL